MQPDTQRIFALYGTDLKQKAVYDTSRGADDERMTYIVRSPDGVKLAIKVTRNSFTTPERVTGWANLIEHYNSLGIYCPRIVKNLSGDCWAELDGCVVYAEEYMKYKPAQDREDSKTVDEKYTRKLYESIGKVAAHPAELVPWHTAYCIYDKFDESDPYDENYECAVKLRELYDRSYTNLSKRADSIFTLYCEKRAKFEPIYRSLPQSVFQGDINDSNILLTRSGNFKGMIDFNLSGSETVINYAYCESLECLNDDSEIDLLLDGEALKKRDAKTAERLSWIGKNYRFTDAERAAWNEYCGIVTPYRWPYYCFFKSLLTNREKYPDGSKYAGTILDWCEYQLTRRDADKLLPAQ